MYSKMAFIHAKCVNFNLLFAKTSRVSIALLITLLSFFVFHEIIFKTVFFDNPYFKVNLVNAKMEWIDLSNKNLQGAILKGANLHGSNLKNSNLKYADLRGSNLKGVNFKNAVLDSAFLNEAILINADLENASLIGADLTMANVKNTLTNNANFQWAILTDLEDTPNDFYSDARNARLAYRHPKVLVKKYGKYVFHNECLEKRDLSDYDLGHTNLIGAGVPHPAASRAGWVTFISSTKFTIHIHSVVGVCPHAPTKTYAAHN